MLATYAAVSLGAIYVASVFVAAYWQQKSVPPDSILSNYRVSMRALCFLPFVSPQRAGILPEHVEQIREHRRRTWVLLAVFLGTPQVGYLCLWLLYAWRT
jgi:hypothetical protein